MSTASPWDNILRQLAPQHGGLNLNQPRFNPRPAGLIRNGSATHILLELFRANPGLFFTHSQLRARTGCTVKATDWALIFLRSQQLIECATDDFRNARYLRYRLSKGSHVNKAEISQAPKAGGGGVSRNAQAMPGAQVQGLSEVRGSGGKNLPTVDTQLGPVHPGHGTGTDTGALAGTQGRDAGVHAGKLHMDNTRPTDAEAPVVPQGDIAGPDDDLCRSDTPSVDAYLVNGEAPDSKRVQPGVAQGDEALQEVNLAILAGRDLAVTGMGTAPGATPFTAMATSEGRDAGGAGSSPCSAPAPGLQAEIFNQPSNLESTTEMSNV
jgi:hypothetical protein